jgi:hypothetical protein
VLDYEEVEAEADGLVSKSGVEARNAISKVTSVAVLLRVQEIDKRRIVLDAAGARARALQKAGTPDPYNKADVEMEMCPHCNADGAPSNDEAEIERVFGMRTLPGGKRARQPWCRGCRRGAAKQARAKQRGATKA